VLLSAACRRVCQCSAGRCRRIRLWPRGRQSGEDSPDEDDGVGLVVSETVEIGRHPVASNLQLLVCEMDGVPTSSVDRRPGAVAGSRVTFSHCAASDLVQSGRSGHVTGRARVLEADLHLSVNGEPEPDSPRARGGLGEVAPL
jgi:hypothetical protein